MSTINFLPQSFYRQRKRKARVWIEGLVVVIAAALLVVAHVAAENSLDSLREYAAQTEAEGTEAQQQFKELAALQSEYRELSGQLRVYHQVLPPVGFTHVLAAISQLAPESIAFTDMRLECKRPTPAPIVVIDETKTKKSSKSKAPPPAKPIDPMVIELTGLSPDDERIADFVGQLAESPLFRRVKLEFSRPTEQGGVLARRFRVTMEVPFDRAYREPKKSGQNEGVVNAD